MLRRDRDHFHERGVEGVNLNDAPLGDQFVDFDIAPLATSSSEADATWSDEDEALTERILDAVTGLETELTEVAIH